MKPDTAVSAKEELRLVIKGLQANVPPQQLADATGFSLGQVAKISRLFKKD